MKKTEGEQIKELGILVLTSTTSNGSHFVLHSISSSPRAFLPLLFLLLLYVKQFQGGTSIRHVLVLDEIDQLLTQDKEILYKVNILFTLAKSLSALSPFLVLPGLLFLSRDNFFPLPNNVTVCLTAFVAGL